MKKGYGNIALYLKLKERKMKIEELLRNARKKLIEKKVEDAELIARVLLQFVLKIDRNELVLKQDQNMEEEQIREYENAIEKVIEGTPLQYITRKQEFYGLNFYVNENVLIPQPDTEILVEQVIELCKKSSEINKILDLCTGSGAIAISIKEILKENCEMHASDISKNAIEVAKINEERVLNKNNQINFIQSDMFEDINDKYDIIVTNPPYIESNTINDLPKDVQNEPKIALDGGEDGLKYYRIIKENIKDYLKEDGYLVMEIGYNQKEAVTNMFHNSRCIKDYAKNDRVVIWKNSIK